MTATLCTDALSKADRTGLVEQLAPSDANDFLSSGQAAQLLGVSSPNTVKNWLNGGYFPGAFQTVGGHWRFPRHEVQEVKSRMEKLGRQNRQRDLMPPDADDNFSPPLL